MNGLKVLIAGGDTKWHKLKLSYTYKYSTNLSDCHTWILLRIDVEHRIQYYFVKFKIYDISRDFSLIDIT